MKVLGIIPSRYGSSRFPGKPLVDILGKSMIQRVYEQSKKSTSLDEVIVATDDKRIFNHVKSFGGEVIMTNENHQSGTERCGEVIQNYLDYDVVINIQGDEPLIQPEQIDEVIQLFKDDKVNIGTVIKQMKNIEDIRNPNRVKVVIDNLKNGLYFSRSPIPHLANIPHEEWLDNATFYKHVGIYAWRLTCLQELITLEPSGLEKQESLEQLRWLYNGYKIRTVETQIETPNIDSPEDLEEVFKQMNNS